MTITHSLAPWPDDQSQELQRPRGRLRTPSRGPPTNRIGRETRYFPLQVTCTLRQTEIESLLIWWCGCYQSEQATSDAQPSNLPNYIDKSPLLWYASHASVCVLEIVKLASFFVFPLYLAKLPHNSSFRRRFLVRCYASACLTKGAERIPRHPLTKSHATLSTFLCVGLLTHLEEKLARFWIVAT